MWQKVTSMSTLSLVLLLALSVGHTQAACKNNEKRAENKAACVGQLYGGIVPYPGDCSKFLVCVPVCEYPTVKECPNGLWWDNTYKFCNLPILVDCDNQGGGTITTTTAKTTTEKTTPMTTTTESSAATTTTKGRCNNERKPENQAACRGQRFGALVAYPGDCSKFLVCVRICEYPVVEECPSGLWWDNTHKFCNVPLLVNCDESEGTTVAIGTTTTEVITTPTTTESSDSSSTTKGRCNNERRPENQAACAGQRFGAIVPYPGDCSKFLVCVRICEYPVVEECPSGLWWDNTHKFCNVPLLVNCDESEGTTVAIGTTTTEVITAPTTTESGDSSSTTKGRCNNERKPENQAACAGQRFGAIVPYPGDCSKFLVCVRICEFPVVEECPSGLWWDNTHKFCNLPLLVNCDESEGTTVAIGTTTTEVITPTTTESSDSSSTTKGRCNNERRPENQAACAGQRFGAIVPYPGDCSKFLVCVRICEFPVVEECPAGLWWDNTHKFCNVPLLVNCDESEGTTVAIGTTTTEVITTPTTTESGDSSSTTKGRCNNERRPENQAACAGKRFGATVPYPGDCSKFLVCVRICEFPVVEECPAGLWWDNTHKFCNLPLLVNCDESEGTTIPIGTTTTEVITTPTTTDSTSTTKDICDNENRPENQAACAGQALAALVSYPGDCSKYLVCIHLCEYPNVRECAPGLWWDNINKFCNFPHLVSCDENEATTVTIASTTESNDCSAPEGMSADICVQHNNGFLIRYPYNCNAYINCTMGCPVMQYCQPDKVFNVVLKICDTADMNECEDLPIPSTSFDSTIVTNTKERLVASTNSGIIKNLKSFVNKKNNHHQHKSGYNQ